MERTLPLNMLEPLPKRVRIELHAETVERYAEVYRDPVAGSELADDKPVVFQEPGCERYVIADGEHRVEAAKRAKLDALPVDLRQGDQDDALAYALGCNVRHGLPRREIDTWHAFCVLMDSPAMKARFRIDQDKADALGVHRNTIVKYKADYRDCAEWAHMLPMERRKRLKAKRAKAKDELRETIPPADETIGPDPETETGAPPNGEYSEPEVGASEDELPPKQRKSREKKPELTDTQRAVAKRAREDAKRQRLDAANRKTFVEGIEACLSIPFDGGERARRWQDIDDAKIRNLRDICDEFLRAREQARAA